MADPVSLPPPVLQLDPDPQRHLALCEAALLAGPDCSAAVRRIAVLGAGTMGAGIAAVLAAAGFAVAVVEPSEGRLGDAVQRVTGMLREAQSRGRIADAQAAAARIDWTAQLAPGVAGADLVIEAVYEDPVLKAGLFAELDRATPPGTILASNTSFQSIARLGAATGRPDRVLGMHFFSPVPAMRLVELVAAPQTAQPVLDRAAALARACGKLPVTVGDGPGFVGNRILAARTAEAQRLALEGNTPGRIDAAMAGFGFRMGPFAMSDLAGTDVSWRMRQAAGEVQEPADTIAAVGRWGVKTGRGYYAYGTTPRDRHEDPEALALIAATAARLGVAPHPRPAEALADRLILPMINEAFRVLDAGIARRPGDIDLIFANGYGWPPGKGGPMFHAASLGPGRLCAALSGLAAEPGRETCAPCDLLLRLAGRQRMQGP